MAPAGSTHFGGPTEDETSCDFGDGHVPARRHFNPNGTIGGSVAEPSRLRSAAVRDAHDAIRLVVG